MGSWNGQGFGDDDTEEVCCVVSTSAINGHVLTEACYQFLQAVDINVKRILLRYIAFPLE